MDGCPLSALHAEPRRRPQTFLYRARDRRDPAHPAGGAQRPVGGRRSFPPHAQPARRLVGEPQREVAYAMPAVSLRNQDGVSAAFPALVDDGRPVLLPISSTPAACDLPADDADLCRGARRPRCRPRPGARGVGVHRPGAGPRRPASRFTPASTAPGWAPTGCSSPAATPPAAAVQKAFNAYRPDKMGTRR